MAAKFITKDVDVATACLISREARKPCTVTFNDGARRVTVTGVVTDITLKSFKPREWEVTMISVVQ